MTGQHSLHGQLLTVRRDRDLQLIEVAGTTRHQITTVPTGIAAAATDVEVIAVDVPVEEIDEDEEVTHPPDSDNGGDGPTGGSSSEDDTAVQRHGRKQFRIKVQKFDGTSSWESWWAHFQNCASYNRWTERDQLAFVKGALTGNAAQVLWDTDRAATSSLKKLVAILKSRYSGERQAENTVQNCRFVDAECMKGCPNCIKI